jgi:hypothetical protein
MMRSWYPESCRAVLYNVSAGVEVLKCHDDASARPQQRPQPDNPFLDQSGLEGEVKENSHLRRNTASGQLFAGEVVGLCTCSQLGKFEGSVWGWVCETAERRANQIPESR